MSLPPLTEVHRVKHLLTKSVASSYIRNPRNLENPWYAVWLRTLEWLTAKLPNIQPVPQYGLWYVGAPVNLDDSDDDEGGSDEENYKDIGDHSDDGLDSARQSPEMTSDALAQISQGLGAQSGLQDVSDDSPDKIVPAIDEKIADNDDSDAVKENKDCGGCDDDDRSNPDDDDAYQDANASFVSGVTIAGSKGERYPDFVLLHLFGRRMSPDDDRSERLGGVRIVHECCPVIVEIKRYPKRSASGAAFEVVLKTKIESAKVSAKDQCEIAFRKYRHMNAVTVIAASGDHWCHARVTRQHFELDHERGGKPEPIEDANLWSTVTWSKVVVLYIDQRFAAGVRISTQGALEQEGSGRSCPTPAHLIHIRVLVLSFASKSR